MTLPTAIPAVGFDFAATPGNSSVEAMNFKRSVSKEEHSSLYHTVHAQISGVISYLALTLYIYTCSSSPSSLPLTNLW